MKIQILFFLGLLTPLYLSAQSPTSTSVYQKSDETFVQKMDHYNFKDNYRAINLKTIIEEGLRKNYDQHIRVYNENILELGWKDHYAEFWYPTIDLVLSSGPQRLDRLIIGKNNTKRSESPAGTLGLEIGDYTLFNWGKDYATYLNNKRIYNRNKQSINEGRRELKQALILQYFDLLSQKKLEKIAKYKLRQASFIYRLNREKISLKKTSKQEYYQARTEYLKAQEEYYQAKIAVQLSDEQMAIALADPPGSRYYIQEELKFDKIKTTIDEAEKISIINNPGILDAKTSLEVAKKNHQIIRKNNLPLPKISINLGAYTHTFDDNRNQLRRFTHEDSSNLEITATINATWSILGSGGLFNQRKTESSFVTKSLRQKLLHKQKHETHSNITSTYRRIRHSEKLMTILAAETANLRKTYDEILDNYTKKRTTFLNFKFALNDLIDARNLEVNTRLEHLKDKIALAQLMGIEDFPGESFEGLAVKEMAE